MKIRLIAVGKIREPYVASACADLRRRLSAYYAYEEIEVKADRSGVPETAMREESLRVLKRLGEGDRLWLLDRAGSQLASEALAGRLAAARGDGISQLTLAIAGTFGAGATLRERADFLWSLSDLTFLHEWARAIVLEQLYRAAKIARNEPYHH